MTCTWNGPICPTCGARFLGSHACSREDIIRKITELARLLDAPRPARSWDPMSSCPCRVENGGSGVCGCILSGPTVTCST